MSNDMILPAIGAALPIADIAEFSAWLIEGERDLEIQDVISADFLNGWDEENRRNPPYHLNRSQRSAVPIDNPYSISHNPAKQIHNRTR